jgi:1-acyl-sn-glycerol-3-phosphate acyltransferase
LEVLLEQESLFKIIGRVIRDVRGRQMDPDSLDNFDPGAIELRTLVDLIGKLYFRSVVRGIENIPEGPVLLVGNHTGGIVFVSPFIFVSEYYKRRGTGERIYLLGHDMGVDLPYLGNFLMKGGVVRASHENSHKILKAGHKLCVFPGGAHEAFRPFADRKKITFGGHRGFARLAIECNVPIVPVVDVGGHETFIVLERGEKIAKAMGIDSLFRIPTFPISLALPWPVMPGPFFYIPLPAKIEVEAGAPIYPSKVLKGVRGAQKRIDRLYDITTGTMQQMADRMHSHRLLPVVG